MGKQTRPETFHAVAALLLVLLATAGLFLLFRLPRTWYHLLAAWLVAINLIAFGYYGYDKARARAGRRRVPEVILHALVLLGGTLGGYAGMQLFRHKTVKGSFRLVFWFIVVLQVGLIAAVCYRLWKDHRARHALGPSPAHPLRSAPGAGRMDGFPAIADCSRPVLR
jgi:uncharacterized membrane protein YsdA (DUF1294 family)